MERTHNIFFRQTAFLLVVSIFMLFIQVPMAQAALVGTQDALVVDADKPVAQRDAVRGFLQRNDVKAQLETLGIKAEDAQARVDTLTDSEVASIAGKLDQLPAGGNSVLGAIVFIFVLLLITDILGLTKIFPFTRSVK